MMKKYILTLFIALFTVALVHSQDEKVFFDVETMPAYAGCEDEVGEMRSFCTTEKVTAYINKNMTYPKEALDQGIVGRVILSYEISKEGLVQNVKILKKAHPLLDAEALRVITSLPAHTPGKQRGKAVVVETRIPIYFRIAADEVEEEVEDEEEEK